MSFALCGQVFGIAGKKIAAWYRNTLSGFTKPEIHKGLHENDTVDRALVDRKTGEVKTVYVPILNLENFGEDMALDDKNINGEGYTIIVKMTLEALQDIRVRYRQEILTKEREDKKDKTKKNRRTSPEEKKSSRYENGETIKEILAKSRYLLFSFSSAWRESQLSRAKILFREFPEIKTAYDCICRFRVWYKKKHENKDSAQKALHVWYEEVIQTKIPELLNLVSSLKRHEGVILNYFSTNQTNAFAESLNSRIAACIRMCFGIRDIDFGTSE